MGLKLGHWGIVVDRDVLWVVYLASVHLITIDEQLGLLYVIALLRLSWTVAKLSYRCPSRLATVCRVRRFN